MSLKSLTGIDIGIDMGESTRLVRAGHLGAATELIGRGLGFRRKASDQTPAAPPAPPSSDRSLRQTIERLRSQPAPARPRDDTGCPVGARFEARVVTNAAGSRPYKLYVPSTYADRRLPLVVVLHGCTQSPDDIAAGTRMNALAEELGFLVAYPGQSKAANPKLCWNWFKPDDQRRDCGEASLVADATRAIIRELKVDPARVFVVGMSAGGAAAANLAAAYPDLYAGVGVHSGLASGAATNLASALSAMRNGAKHTPRSGTPVPTIVFHGTADSIVNPANAGEVVAQAAGAASASETTRGTSTGGIAYRRTVRRDARGRIVAEQWMLEGAGHAWAGGSPEGSFTDPRGPDASREMLRFFGIA